MAIVVEDGSGLADAEAYITVADADTYFAARGNAVWAALDEPAKEAALRLGTDYMEAVYGERWKGARVSMTQALSWPRDGVCVNGFEVPDDVVPVAVQRANAELAVRASAGTLLADQGAQVVSETVGPISVTYAEGARQWTRYAYVDGLLGAYFGGSAGQIRVVRA
jgi:DnaT-like ssDNA binding protein